MKKIWITAVTASLLLGMTACGSADTAQTEASAAAETEADLPDEASEADETEHVVSEADFTGLWEYDDYYMWYQINDDGTAIYYNVHGTATDMECDYEDGVMTLSDGDGYGYVSLSFENGVLTDNGGDTLFASSLPGYYGYLGTWEYDDYDLTLEISANGSYTLYEDGEVYEDLEDCSFEVYTDGLMLYDHEGEAMAALYTKGKSGNVLVDDDGDTLSKVLPEAEETEETEEIEE